MSPTLAETLERQASEDPVQPWLFFPSGWQWRWLSWQEGVAAYREVTAALTEARLAAPPGWSLGLDPVATPGNLLLVLASEELGLPWSTSVVPGDRPGIDLEYRSERPPHDRIAVRARWVESGGERSREPTRRLKLGPSRQRDVAFLSRDLGSAAALGFVRWSLDSGAALVLEPDRAARLPSLLWVRPTVALAGLELEQELAATLGLDEARPGRNKRRARRRLRLRALVVPGLGARTAAWQRLGVQLVA